MTSRYSDQPRYRTVLPVDIEGSTALTNHAKARARNLMYELVTEALLAGGIGQQLHDPFVDRGDGLLALALIIHAGGASACVNSDVDL